MSPKTKQKEIEIKKAVVYVRVSTEEQAKHGYSLAQQETECREFAEKQGFKIDRVFIEEGESAKDLNRTKLKSMFEYCANNYKNIDALIFWKWDRLSRGEQQDYLELGKFFSQTNIQPLSVTENNDDTAEAEFLRWITQGTSRYEWRKIQERTKLGLRGAVEQGRTVNLAPFGYLNDTKLSLIPCPENAKYVQKAFKMFATGAYSQSEIVKHLKELGAKNINGNKLSRILRNKTYIGLLDYAWLEAPKRGIFEPLIDEQTFYRVQALLAGKKPLVTGYQRNREDFPLRRYVRCPNCNSPLTASYSKGRKEKYAYYHCSCKDCGTKIRIPKDRLEKAYTEHLETIKPKTELLNLFRGILTDVYKEHNKDIEEKIRLLNKRLSELTETKLNLSKKYAQDKISDEDYKLVNDDINACINESKASLASIDRPQEEIDKYLDNCCFMLNNLKELWINSDLNFRQRLQRLIYPNGVQYDLSKFRTNRKSVIFSFLDCSTDELLKMGRLMGFEPMHIGTTIRGLNRLTTGAITSFILS